MIPFKGTTVGFYIVSTKNSMISAIILTKNQEHLIKVCLESVKWADEIVIVDDESTNGILDVARSYTDKIFAHKLTNFADQRNFAIEKATGDWVLFIDPDERVTKDLRDEIQTVVTQSDVAAGAMPRRNFFLGSEQKMVGGWPDYVVRLLKRSSFKGWQGDLHEQPTFDGKLVHLKNPLIHLTHTDIESMTKKTLEWSKLEAKLRIDANHPPMTGPRFLKVFVTTFLDWYIKKGGYKGGTTGTIEAIFQTFSVFMTYVRLWEMQQKPSLKEKYEEFDKRLLESNFSDDQLT